jgi:hypothetical protein
VTDHSLLGAIQDALDHASWDVSVASVKTLVINAIERMDPTVKISDTKYFSHSFVPDLILEWPKASASQSRDVYLRVQLDEVGVRYDLATIGSGHPILMGLSAIDDRLLSTSTEMERSKVLDVLLTDPVAVADLGVGVQAEFGAVLPGALLRSGEGLVGIDNARRLSASGSAIFAAAKDHLPVPISDNRPIIDEFISGRGADRLFNLTRIVWVATGGDPMTFPFDTSLEALDIDALRYLLHSGPSTRLDFWRSVGRDVSVELLLAVGIERAPNLDVLVATNLDRLAFRHVAVVPGRLAFDRSSHWRVETDRNLVFEGATCEAVFALHKEHVRSHGSVLDPLLPSEFARRIEGRKFTSLTFRDQAGNTVTTENSAELKVDNRGALRLLSDGPAIRVMGVGLDLSGKRLDCRFGEGTAAGKTTSTFALDELLSSGLPVLTNLTEEDTREIEQIRATFGMVSADASGDENGQLDLSITDFDLGA